MSNSELSAWVAALVAVAALIYQICRDKKDKERLRVTARLRDQGVGRLPGPTLELFFQNPLPQPLTLTEVQCKFFKSLAQRIRRNASHSCYFHGHPQIPEFGYVPVKIDAGGTFTIKIASFMTPISREEIEKGMLYLTYRDSLHDKAVCQRIRPK